MDRSLSSSIVKHNDSKYSTEGYLSSEREMKIKLLQKDLSIQGNQIEIMKSEIQNLNGRKEDLKDQLRCSKIERNELVEQLKNFCKLTEELKLQIEDKSNMNHILHCKLSEAENMVSERELNLKSQNEKERRLLETLQDADSLIIELKKKLSKSSKKIDESAKTNSELNLQIEMLKKQLAETQTDVKNLKVNGAKNTRKVQHLKDLEGQYQALQEAFNIEESSKRKFEEEIKILSSKVVDYEEKVKKLMKDKLHSEKDSKFENQFKNLKEEIQNLSEDKLFYKKEVERLEKKVTEDSQEYEKDLKSIKLALNGNNEVEGFSTLTFDIIKEVRTFRKDLNLYKELLDKKDKEVNDIKMLNKSHEIKVRETELKFREFENKDKEILKLRESHAENHKKLQEDLETLNRFIATKNIEIEDLKASNLGMKGKLISQEKMIESFKSRYSCMQDLLEQLKQNSKEIDEIKSKTIGSSSIIALLIEIVNSLNHSNLILQTKSFFHEQITNSYLEAMKALPNKRKAKGIFRKCVFGILFVIFLKSENFQRNQKSGGYSSISILIMGKNIKVRPLSYKAIETIQSQLYKEIDYSDEQQIAELVNQSFSTQKSSLNKLFVTNSSILKKKLKEFSDEKRKLLKEFESMQTRVQELESFTLQTLQALDKRQINKQPLSETINSEYEKENSSILNTSTISDINQDSIHKIQIKQEQKMIN